MPFEQTSLLPTSYDMAVNVQIRIEPYDRGYRICIKADWSDWCDFIIPLTQNDVQNLNTKLQVAIEEVSCKLDIGPTEGREALLELAEKGNSAFKKIFIDGELRETIRVVLKECKTIQVTTQDFFVPWELLYDGPLDNNMDASMFWGMRYIIARNLIRAGSRDAFASPIIAARPQVGFISYNGLKHVLEQELPMLQKLEQQEKISLSLLQELDPDRRQQGLAEFGQFLSKELEVLHLACHANEELIKSGPRILATEAILREPYLLISKEFRVEMDDFDAREFKIDHKPLVILNACLTGTINPLCTSNWAMLFWRQGAKGVLATEFLVPDWFASEFVEEVYNQLLSGKPIGQALLLTRGHFWEEKGNPLGLAYALYSRLDIRIAK